MPHIFFTAFSILLLAVAPVAAQGTVDVFSQQRVFPNTPVRPEFFRNLTRPGFVPPTAGVYYYLPYYYVYDPYLVPVGPYGSYYSPYLYYQNLTLQQYYGAIQAARAQAQPPAAPAIQPPENPPPPAKPPEARGKDDLDQQGEMYRLLQLGNKAFANAQYDDALKLYEKAQVVAPMEPHPAFHSAQALIALGSYHKAFTEVRRGLRWQPNWPESPFKPRALYGNRTATFQKHLAKLADAVERNPNDDSLHFLLGYQLWFDGKRDQAEVLMKRSAALALDRTHIDRFLGIKDKN